MLVIVAVVFGIISGLVYGIFLGGNKKVMVIGVLTLPLVVAVVVHLSVYLLGLMNNSDVAWFSASMIIALVICVPGCWTGLLVGNYIHKIDSPKK